MKNQQTLVALDKILADSYILMLKTQNYHWNVVGENFKALHELFQTQYEDLFSAIDEIAERIRTLGSKVEGSFEHFKKLSDFRNANKNFHRKEMIQDLLNDHELIAKILREAIKLAQSEGDEISADLFIQRAKIHEKNIWMLTSSI
jgi:starvation-inducible DNA-binding protein